MWVVRRILGTVGGRTLAALVVLILAYQIWIGLAASGKVADGVGADPDARGRFAVDVVLDFPPERFHVLELQEYGRTRGTSENVIHLHMVTQDSVDAMARKYWIKEIRPGERVSLLR
ncbi:hypothetical protein G1H11_03365 [Phytoactinopolyspora alkaliphila]|uniref:Uncharacterized protein n=2 Tax=Phytoactinopolyspora alkaliphila TaxID=1783498 RepID=A0A6N9YHD8_9ACTN|nr:hypothetical protein [Phytoactinopolyspora alkaliphila]